MRATTRTLLTLWEWARAIGLDPYPVAQMGTNTPQAYSTQNERCDYVMYQHAWQQHEHLSREEVADAIAQAEELFASYIGYWPAPKYIEGEVVQYQKAYNRVANYGSGIGIMRTPEQRHKAIRMKYSMIQNMGTESISNLGTSSVTREDNDGDGVKERFRFTAPVAAGTLPGEIVVWFKTADCGPLAQSDCEIKPLEVSVSGTTATVTGYSALLIKPKLQEDMSASDLDASDDTIYASDVVVCRSQSDGTDTGNLIWENIYPCDQGDPCLALASTTCFVARNLELGIVAPVAAQYDADVGTFLANYPDVGYREPDRVAVNYQAGYPRQSNGLMDRRHARIIALLATSLLPNKICGCDRANQRLSYYRSYPKDGQGQYFVTETLLENPFGATNGAMEAWKLAEPLMQYGSPLYG